jgi:hypothetical protein
MGPAPCPPGRRIGSVCEMQARLGHRRWGSAPIIAAARSIGCVTIGVGMTREHRDG